MKTEWISVKERLPERYVNVIICIAGSSVTGTAWIRYDDKGDSYWEDAWSNHMDGITHWMPLPEPPKQ